MNEAELQDLQELQRMYDRWERELLQRGKAAGGCNAIITVLEARHIPISPQSTARIQATASLRTLRLWLTRAVTVATADEIFGPTEQPVVAITGPVT